MSLTEVLPEVQSLSRNDKIRLIELLVQELEHEEHPSTPDGGGSTAFGSFLRGLGSVLEFFPSPERFDAWRMAPDIPLEDWPMTVRGLLAELPGNASQRGEPSSLPSRNLWI